MKKGARKACLYVLSSVLVVSQLAVAGSVSAADTDVSAGKSVSASSESNYTANYGNDRDTNTWWGANSYNSPQWYKVDLGDYYDISKIETWLPWSSNYRFNLEVSRDGLEWASQQTRQNTGQNPPNPFSRTTQGSFTGGNGGYYTDTFSPNIPYVRYVRVNFPVANNGAFPAVDELVVFSPTGSPVSAPESQQTGTAVTAGSSWTLDFGLGNNTDLTRSEITLGAAQGYKIEVSQDNAVWTQVADKWNASGNTGLNSDTFAAITSASRYLRYTFNGSLPGASVLTSIHAYGMPTLVDVLPAAPIANLAASNPQLFSIDLSWGRPADPDSSASDPGSITAYQLRYSTSGPITTESAWNGAQEVFGVPAPSGGATESMTVGGLQPNTTYHFSIRSVDKAGHLSGLSNSGANAKTKPEDQTPPSRVTDLTVAGTTQTTVTLQWTTPADLDGTGGPTNPRELKYDLRYSTTGPIDSEADWDNAIRREFAPDVYEPGRVMMWDVNPLFPGNNYWFAVKVVDSGNNYSPLSTNTPGGSSVVEAVTLDIDPDHVRVTDLWGLRDAILNAPPTGRVITLAPGTYQMMGWTWSGTTSAGELDITNKQFITIQGETGNYEDVVIRGQGMYGYGDTGTPNGTTRIPFNISNSDFITIKDLTIRDAVHHSIKINSGSDYFYADNVKMWNVGEGGMKITSPKQFWQGPYVDYGVVENSVVGFDEAAALTNRAGAGTNTFSFGIEPVASREFRVSGTKFYNIYNYNPNFNGGYPNSNGLYTKGRSFDLTFENNTFINNWIALGFGVSGSRDESSIMRGLDITRTNAIGGVIRNNLVINNKKLDPSKTNIPSSDAGIFNQAAAGSKVYNNTVFNGADFGSSIDIRYKDGNLVYNNVMNHNINLRDGAVLGGSGGNLENVTDSGRSAMFVDPFHSANPDYHLKSGAGNPAIDTGVNVGSSGNGYDIDGQARPAGSAYDIGADEYGASVVTPAAPEERFIIAAAGDSKVNLTWRAVLGATSYKVKTRPAGGSFGTPVDTNGLTHLEVTGLTNGTQYEFVITPYNTTGSSDSAPVLATPVSPTIPLEVPGNVKATLIHTNTGKSQIDISWNTVKNATGVNVYRKVGATGTWSKIATDYKGNPGAGNKFVVFNQKETAIVNGTTYYYKVTAYNAATGAESAFSPEVSASPVALTSAPPAPVIDFVSPAKGQVAMKVTIADSPANEAYGYALYVSRDGGSTWSKVNNWNKPFTDGTVQHGEGGLPGTRIENGTYWYKVTAVNGYNNGNATDGTGALVREGPASNVVKVDVLTPPPIPVVAAVPGNNRVDLGWTSDSGSDYGPLSFNVKRRTVGGEFQLLARGVANTSYADLTAVNGTAYEYVVTAVGPQGEGGYDYVTAATPVPSAGGGGDTTAPAAATLTEAGKNTTSVTLGWTAPGDDGAAGTAASYDIRYSTSAITDTNFSSATSVTGVPAPAVAGTAQSVTVAGLNPGTPYYFAMKTSDEVQNTSLLSNVLQVTTSSAPASVQYQASTGFSGTQGQNQWYYYYYQNGYVSFVNFDGTKWYNGTSPFVDAAGMQPSSLDAVRAWVAPASGTVVITGSLFKRTGAFTGDGVNASIILNQSATPVLSVDLTGNPASPASTDTGSVAVAAGDVLYFRVNKAQSTATGTTNNTGDKVDWDPLVTFTPN